MKSLENIIEQDSLAISRKIDFRQFDGKTIILTGASGLIGTYILAVLREARKKGARIKIFASSRNKFPPYLAKIAEGVKLIEGDITEETTMVKFPKADFIIHSAGYGQPGRFMENPITTLEINTTSTIALFRKLKKGGKFLFISTSEVYSGLLNPPFKETEIGNTNTTHTRACYIEGKRCGEAIVNSYRTLGLDAKSARLSLAYGPGTKPGDKRVINAFIEKALGGKLELLDRGEAKRTYCYISDAVEILFHILISGKEPIYNVGGNSTVTVANLAKIVGALLNVPVIFPKTSGEGKAGAPADVRLDMTKVKTEFGKTNFVPLDEGLRRTIEWQKKLYGKKN